MGNEHLHDEIDEPFRKSSFSGQGQCVEWSRQSDGCVALRNSKQPTGGTLVFTSDEWSAFLAAVKAGEAEDPSTSTR